ncbi:Peptidase M14 carboxypeptidase A domain-containing protein [Flavobacterium longum]|uniref:M14 family metallopeptidase n=1 Tax=Flavobacterium longum TaxID=1299340 RepID=UPI0039E7ADB4
MDFESAFNRFREPSIGGRYLHLGHVQPLIERFRAFGQVTVIGQSVNGAPLQVCIAGEGNTKILMWSQMHGNESTTTKALFDLFNWLQSGDAVAQSWLASFTLYMVPMLNPDGAKAYTRENANGIDLNRDFLNLSQPESRALLDYFHTLNPDFCFNLHDQRTIYGAGESGKPATVSFLSPSFNEARDVSPARIRAMNVIAAMNDTLQSMIPGQIGRFDDSFNRNCVGDTFQWHNVPTILFEAGHFPEDYQRETTRKFIFTALASGLTAICENVIVNNRIDDYLNIPQNKINFLDFVYKNISINCDGIKKITNFGAQFSEVLRNGDIAFEAVIAETEIPDQVFGHVVFDGLGERYRDGVSDQPIAGRKADFFIGNRKFTNGTEVDSVSGKP